VRHSHLVFRCHISTGWSLQSEMVRKDSVRPAKAFLGLRSIPKSNRNIAKKWPANKQSQSHTGSLRLATTATGFADTRTAGGEIELVVFPYTRAALSPTNCCCVVHVATALALYWHVCSSVIITKTDAEKVLKKVDKTPSIKKIPPRMYRPCMVLQHFRLSSQADTPNR
jgi:hypothetical protein